MRKGKNNRTKLRGKVWKGRNKEGVQGRKHEGWKGRGKHDEGRTENEKG